MSRVLQLFIVVCIMLGISIACAAGPQSGKIEISFDYNRAERDYANNQFAVWIEDLDGNLIKTLFVTKFTATRGWKIRQEALPTWKKKANISRLKKEEIDAVSGATPPAQHLVFTWEGDAESNTFLLPGRYNYFVECNYYWEDRVLYSGTIRVGKGKDSSEAVPHYSTEKSQNYSIVENVSAQFVPSES